MPAGLTRRAVVGESADISGPCKLFVERLKGNIVFRLVGPRTTKFVWSAADARQNRRRPWPVDGEELQPRILE